MRQQRGPVFATVLAGLLWGSSFIVVKHGLRSIDPFWFVLLRFSTAAVIAMTYAAATGRLRAVGRLLRDPLVVWLGVSNGIGFAMQFQGQTLTTAGKAALFVNSSTILVAVASRFVFRERFTPVRIAAVVIGMLGVLLVTTGGSLRLTPGPELTGDALVFAAAIIWTAFILLDKRIVGSGDVDVMALTAAMVTMTALTALPIALILGRGGPPPIDSRLWVVLYTAVFCTVLPFLLWSWGLKSISATSSCVILLIEIVFALALAAIIFGERLTPGGMTGAALIMAAVLLVSLPRHRRTALPVIVVFALLSLTVPAGAVPADSLFVRAERELEAGQIDTADGLYREMLEIDDDDHRAFNGLALVGVARGDADLAIEYARKAVRKDRKNSDYHMTLALGYATRLVRGGLSAAFYVGKFKGECETAIRLDPTNVDAHMALVQFYASAPGLMGGSMEKARETALTVAELDEFLGYIANGMIAEIEEDMSAAEAGYRAAALVDTADPEGWGGLGMFYMRTGQYEKAIPVGRLAARLAPDASEAPYQLGKAFLLLGDDLDESERWFRIAIDLIAAEPYPDEHMLASAHWRLGMVQERRGDLDAARASWETALAIEKGHEQAAAALDSLTVVLPRGR